ncbi:hypothetical protein JOC78_003534 [Bacillus ectoiniformans]|uniref:hypothetical protein n=1 Tax=Bacillus ectoiniformans TaxID=1494429 RepID=UPI0019579E90|nr:hypothetical protein [Bacillus ectoiniformans]MBM7650537.1 hypothetical protein [Bacillus ectoiniformans]
MSDKRLGRDPLDWIGKSTEQQKEQVVPQQAIRKSAAGRPRKIKREIEKSSQEGLPVNWTRYTVILREDLLEKLKDYAWTDRRTMKDIMNEMVEGYLADKEIMERDDK